VKWVAQKITNAKRNEDSLQGPSDRAKSAEIALLCKPRPVACALFTKASDDGLRARIS
jgi:hypothetical protein